MDPACAAHESYDPVFFDALFRAEDKHFWFRARNRIIAAILKNQVLNRLPSIGAAGRRATTQSTGGGSSQPSGRALSRSSAGALPSPSEPAQPQPAARVLELGCGTGNVLRVLEHICRGATVIGMDLFGEGLRFARQRTSCPLIAADVHHPPFIVPFDLVCAFDVLEHLQDDLEVLKAVRKLLRSEGTLALTVPAHPSLWSYFDVASRHCRRYRPKELKRKLAAAGFDTLYLTQFMAALFPLTWLKRRLGSTPSGKSTEMHPDTCRNLALAELRIVPVLNLLLTAFLALEAPWLARGFRLPLGTSLLAIASPAASPQK